MRKLTEFLAECELWNPAFIWRIRAGCVDNVVEISFVTRRELANTSLNDDITIDFSTEMKNQIEAATSFKYCYPLCTPEMQAFTIKCEV